MTGFSGIESQDSLPYKVPTLRNLAFTSPYFNDGSVESLDDVVNLFAMGEGNQPAPLCTRFQYKFGRKKDLVRFLLSLSDSSFIKKHSCRIHGK